VTEFVRAPKAKQVVVPPPPMPAVPPPPRQPPLTFVTNALARLHGQSPEEYWTQQVPPLVILLRGAPGAGKSTCAARYQARWPEETVIVSATDYFRDESGVVHFRLEELAASHEWCRQAFAYLCTFRVPRILVDNTHLRQWEYSATVHLATEQGYRVFQHVCTPRRRVLGLKGSLHHVATRRHTSRLQWVLRLSITQS
jgi:hypothetical protein